MNHLDGTPRAERRGRQGVCGDFAQDDTKEGEMVNIDPETGDHYHQGFRGVEATPRTVLQAGEAEAVLENERRELEERQRRRGK